MAIKGSSSGATGVITAINGTSVTITQTSATDFTTSDKLEGNGTATTGSPYTGTNQAGAVPPEVLVPQADLAVSSTYYARVQYATTNASAATSNFSAWSSFATAASFVPAPGTAMGGGYFAGQILVFAGQDDGTNPLVDTVYNLIVAPIRGDNTGPNIAGTLYGQYGGGAASSLLYYSNNTDGLTGIKNTVYGKPATDAYAADATTPAFNWCASSATGPNGGGGIGGFTDWYVPAKNELEIVYFNLKPDATSNDTSSGINPNAIPARASAYTSGNPAQTTSTLFQSGGNEAFSTTAIGYWSSTGFNSAGFFSSGGAWSQRFDNGQQNCFSRSNGATARAIRRVAA